MEIEASVVDAVNQDSVMHTKLGLFSAHKIRKESNFTRSERALMRSRVRSAHWVVCRLQNSINDSRSLSGEVCRVGGCVWGVNASVDIFPRLQLVSEANLCNGALMEQKLISGSRLSLDVGGAVAMQ